MFTWKRQQNAYQPRVSLQTLAVMVKHDSVETTSLCNKKNPINTNAQKLMKTQTELFNTYIKKPTEFIHDQINKIRR